MESLECGFLLILFIDWCCFIVLYGGFFDFFVLWALLNVSIRLMLLFFFLMGWESVFILFSWCCCWEICFFLLDWCRRSCILLVYFFYLCKICSGKFEGRRGRLLFFYFFINVKRSVFFKACVRVIIIFW